MFVARGRGRRCSMRVCLRACVSPRRRRRRASCCLVSVSSRLESCRVEWGLLGLSLRLAHDPLPAARSVLPNLPGFARLPSPAFTCVRVCALFLGPRALEDPRLGFKGNLDRCHAPTERHTALVRQQVLVQGTLHSWLASRVGVAVLLCSGLPCLLCLPAQTWHGCGWLLCELRRRIQTHSPNTCCRGQGNLTRRRDAQHAPCLSQHLLTHGSVRPVAADIPN